MIDLNAILYPTDFSEYSENAEPYVVEFAKKFGAKVLLVHVVSVPSYAVSYEIAVDVVSLRESMEASATKRIEEVAKRLKDQGIEVEPVIRIGTAFVEIIEAARKHKAELIVMPTHGWGAFKHMLLGSTAEKVVRKAPCPVLTVRSPEHDFVHP